MNRVCTARFSLGLALVVLAAPAAGAGPVPVSPGSSEGFRSAGSACPTFSWSGVEKAAGYELVIYAVDGTASALPAAAVEPRIRQRLPGGALSWTPPAESCLEASGSYAWAVRALGGPESGWSESALFKIAPVPIPSELASAVERAVAGYLERRGVVFEPDGQLAALLARELSAPRGFEAASAGEQPVARSQTRYVAGRALGPDDPQPLVAQEDVELWLSESGSALGDYLQLVLSTPDFDGDPVTGDAWMLGVVAQTGSAATGNLFLSSPSGLDVFQAEPVGIGTDPPILRAANLELNNIVRLIPKTSGSRPLCTGPADEGQLYYENVGNDLCYCDGSSWKKVDGDGAC